MAAQWSFEALEDYLEQAAGTAADDPRERKRRQIVQAATELFVRQGYRKTTMSEVAAQAGVAKATIYLYAHTKADLMLQAIVEEKRHYLQVLRPVLESQAPPRQRLKSWLRAALVVSTQMPLVSRLIGGDREILAMLQDVDVEIQDRAARVQLEVVTEMLDLAAGTHRWTGSELRDRARVLIGLLYSSGRFSDDWVRGWLTTERFAELLAEIVVDGVCSQPVPADGA